MSACTMQPDRADRAKIESRWGTAGGREAVRCIAARSPGGSIRKGRIRTRRGGDKGGEGGAPEMGTKNTTAETLVYIRGYIP